MGSVRLRIPQRKYAGNASTYHASCLTSFSSVVPKISIGNGKQDCFLFLASITAKPTPCPSDNNAQSTLLCLTLQWTRLLSLPLHWTSCSAYLPLNQSLDTVCLSIGPVAQSASSLGQSLDTICLSIGPSFGLSTMLCLPVHWTSHWTQPASPLGQLLSLPLHWTSHWTQTASPIDSTLCYVCISIGPAIALSLPLHLVPACLSFGTAAVSTGPVAVCIGLSLPLHLVPACLSIGTAAVSIDQ